MSVSSGLNAKRISILPLNQITPNWTGNNTPVTYLSKGVYLIMYNFGFQATVGAITSTFVSITKNQPYGVLDYQELVSSPETGQMGGGVLIQSIMNSVVIDADNTPIYVNITNTITAGTNWAIQINNQKYTKFFNRVVTIKMV